MSKRIELALEMEREQIMDAANLPIRDRGYDAAKFSNVGEQYYAKTYGAQTPQILHDPQSRGHLGC